MGPTKGRKCPVSPGEVYTIANVISERHDPKPSYLIFINLTTLCTFLPASLTT
jgi:hypothetical protein